MAIDDTKYSAGEQREINRLIAEGKSEEEAINEIIKERKRLLLDENQLLDERIKKQQTRIDLLHKANAAAKTGYEHRERSRELAVLEAKQQQDILQLLMNKVFEGQKLNEQEEELYKKAGNSYKQLAKTLDATKLLVKAREEVNDLVRTETGFQSAINKALAKAVALGENRNFLAVAHKKTLIGIESAMIKVWKAGWDAMMGMDQAISDFNKTFQLGEQYTDQIQSTYTEMNAMGVSIEDATKATQDLIQNVSDFTMMSAAQQKSLTETAATFNELGVNTSNSTKIMQASIKSFGIAAGNMNTTISGLAANARELGVDQETYFNQLQQHSGALAKFGSDAIDTFKDLQHVQKITGMDMEKLLAITNKFDTFEGAAEQAGKLNAALGGNMVNAMDLMMETDPVGRFEQIRDAMLDSGLAFDDMSYYQKQYYMQALGLNDMSDLAVMLSGDLNDLAGAANESGESLIEQRDRAKRAQSIMESYKNILADLGEALLPLGEMLQDFSTHLLKNEKAVKQLFYAFVAYRGFLIAGKTAMAAMSIAQALNVKGIIARIFAKKGETLAEVESTAAKKFNNREQRRQNNLQRQRRATMASSIPVMLAFGFAIMMIGAGVFLAATGIGIMASQVAKLNADQLDAFTTALAIMGGTLVALILTFALLIKPAAVAAVALIAFGKGLALVGLGVLLAGAGIALIAHGFQAINASIDEEKLGTLGLFLVSIGLAAPLIALGGAGLVVFAVGLGYVALAMALISEKKMTALSEFTASLAATEVEKMDLLASSIERITKAMDDVPAKKSIAISKAIDSVTTAAVITAAIGAGVTRMPDVTPNNNTYTSGPNAGTNTEKAVTRIPIQFIIDGDKFGETVIEVVGNAVYEAN